MAVENPFIGDHYHFVERPTRLQLNTQLRQLYEQLPYSPLIRHVDIPRKLREPTDEFLDEWDRTTARRARSETRGVLVTRLAVLLLHAPITYSFRQFIIDEFSFDYRVGVNKEDPSSLRIAWMLDSDDLESGGIFDPKKAKDFERRGFRQLSGFRPANERLLGAIDQEALEKYYKDRKERGIQNEREKLLTQWREEFVERYDEESLST